MSDIREFKRRLAEISRLWEQRKYERAFATVEALLKLWPGNAHLYVLWASLVQLQEVPGHDLNEARKALQNAVQLDDGSPAASIELGHFLDNVDDDPKGVSRSYAEGVAAARQLLIDGLIGQAKVFRQLNRNEEFLRCVLELLHLARFESGSKRPRAGDSGIDISLDLAMAQLISLQLKGRNREQIQDLLNEAVGERLASTEARTGS